MAALLGWNYGKWINLFIAAVAYGPAIAYSVPEKKQILRFLAHYLISINPYTPKIDLQDHLYSLLIIRLNTSLLSLESHMTVRFGVAVDRAIRPEYMVIVSTDKTAHFLALNILQAVGHPFH